MFNIGVFPGEFKVAEVIPIYKSGDKACINNYRTISILPTISKVVEKLLNKRLIDFLETKNLISKFQFGLRGKISTNNVVHELTDHIVNKLDNRKKFLQFSWI